MAGLSTRDNRTKQKKRVEEAVGLHFWQKEQKKSKEQTKANVYVESTNPIKAP